MNMRDWAENTGWAILILVVVGAAPFGFIWAMNTFFPALAIPYTFKTWAAALILLSVFSGHTSRRAE